MTQLDDQPEHTTTLDVPGTRGRIMTQSHFNQQSCQESAITDGSDMPSELVGDKLIDAYYARVHPKHPFLPRQRVQSLHEARRDLIPAHKAEAGQRSCCYATLQLVYAIGARYLQLTNDDDHSVPGVS
jgi:hypothetical protein